MYLVANFANSLHIELAISGLEQNGVPRNKILAIPLELVKSDMVFDSINKADGISNLDLALILGTMSMVIGVIYGYVLAWGPIIWGLIGLVAGNIVGFLIDIIPKKKKPTKKSDTKGTNSVILLIHCEVRESKEIRKILSEYFALSIGKMEEKVNGGGNA